MTSAEFKPFIIYLLGEPVKRKGSELIYHCPFSEKHSGGEDNNPSFYFNVEKGTYYCHGCGSSGVWKKLNEELGGNMRTTQIKDQQDKTENTDGLTLENYAEEKNLDLELLKKLGVKQSEWLGTSAVEIPYRDREGKVTATRYRLAINGGSTNGRFRWEYKEDNRRRVGQRRNPAPIGGVDIVTILC